MEIVAVNEQKIHGRFSNIYRLIRLQLKSTVFKHVLAWCIYIIYAYLTNLIATPDENFLDIVFANMLSIWSFYAGYFSLLVSFDRKRPLTAVLLWLVGLGILFVLRYVYAYILLDMLGLKPYTTDRFQVIIRDSIISYVRFFIYSAGFYYARKPSRPTATTGALEWPQERKER